MTHQILALRNPLALVADVGIPMIFVTLPLMVCALVPVILVETWVARPPLKISYGRSIWVVAVANVVSTLVGIPAAWAAMYGLELLTFIAGERFWRNAHNGPVLRVAEVVLGSAWLGDTGLLWAVPLAATILLIPSFFASWYIEAFIVDKMVEPEWPIVRSAMFKANLASYGLLFIGACGWLVLSLARHPKS